MSTNHAPLNDTQIEFINQISNLFPNRKKAPTGPVPIDKKVILTEVFKLVRFNLQWRHIKHSTVCRNYIKECQRRGSIKKVFHLLTKEFNKYRTKRSIIDATEIKSYRFKHNVSFSGKCHNLSTKVSVEITPEYIPLGFIIRKGSYHESRLLNKYLGNKTKLPYELLMDRGFEGNQRRRDLKKKHCQVRMEQKVTAKGPKKGRRFTYTREHKRERLKVERFFSWLKSFRRIEFRRERTSNMFNAFVTIGLIYLTWKRKL